MMHEKHDKKVAVFGLFHDADTLGRAVDALQTGGFPTTDISALMPRSQSSARFAHEHHTKLPEGAAAGATAGVVTGGALGLLVGFGVLAIPGLGPLIAAGPIIAAFAGAGAGGAVGTLTGALIGMGIPEYEAKRYESFVSGGGMLLSVHCDDKEAAHRAKSILDGFGATGIDDVKEARVRHHRGDPEVIK